MAALYSVTSPWLSVNRVNAANDAIERNKPGQALTDARSAHAWHLFPIRLREPSRRNRIIEELRGRGIGASVHFIPVHLHSFYAETYGYRRGDFPVAEAAFDSLISLPLWPGLPDDDVAYIAETLGALLDVRCATAP